MRLGSTQLGTARLDGRCAVKRIPRRSCSDKNTYGAAGDLESRGCRSSGIAATAGHQEMVLIRTVPPAIWNRAAVDHQELLLPPAIRKWYCRQQWSLISSFKWSSSLL
jgi:hypothetical protein